MISAVRFRLPWRSLLVALLLAPSLLFFFPGTSKAHAVLLRSDPAANAVLPVAPDLVRLWFSEDFNATLSTAVVVNEAGKHVDIGDAHVSQDDATEMDVDLTPGQPPAVYTVVYRTVATDDGHVIIGSFLFTVARPDGTVPTLRPGANPGAHVLGATSLSGEDTGQLDGPTLFNLLMITLVELGAIFYAGASIWQLFVLRPASEEHAEVQEINQRTHQRFERHLALPTLLVLLLANTGVLLGQALGVTGGNWGAAFAPSLLVPLIATGHFGIFWLVREIIVLVALRLAIHPLQLRRRTLRPNTVLLWLNVILGLLLFLTLSLTSHAAAAESDKLLPALIADWLHLLAAAFWIGGMFFIALSYLPVLRTQPFPAQARALTRVLPYYTPWALAGVILMAVTGPFGATVQLNSWTQLISTAYGRVLVVKVLLVGGLLITSAVHVFLLRPRLKKAYRKYAFAVTRLQTREKALVSVPASSEMQEHQEAPAATTFSDRQAAREVQLRERQLTQRTRRLTRVLRWEPVMGVAVLVCVGLLNVFGGTLTPIAAAAPTASPTAGPTQALHVSAHTSDNLFTITLQITPGQVGSNAFLATIQERASEKVVTNAQVTLSLSDLDMDMGTQTITLQADGKGHFSGLGDFLMGGTSGGHWQIHFQIRTPDQQLHQGTVNVQIP